MVAGPRSVAPARQDWAGRRVFITGHMGFKGAWLCALLSRLGAETFGYGLDPRPRLLYRDLTLPRHTSVEGDINDTASLRAALAASAPDVVFHLAAQPLVRASYADPLATFETNVMGTARLLDAIRSVPSVRAALVVTSDKVYRNSEWAWGYRETDPLGGSDPYSASKAAAEILTSAMASSYFSDGPVGLATVRAGNVIGGGDWAVDRLVPDAVRACEQGQPLVVRNPSSTRPWQHVLDPLAGYLAAAERLLGSPSQPYASWNFGPSADDLMSVGETAELFVQSWGNGASWRVAEPSGTSPKEARVLAIDSSLARLELGWRPRWSTVEAIRRTASWYRRFARSAGAGELVEGDITDYLANQHPKGENAQQRGLGK